MIFSNSAAMKKFSDKGICTKETAGEIAESSDVVITMLPSSSNVSNLCFHLQSNFWLYFFY